MIFLCHLPNDFISAQSATTQNLFIQLTFICTSYDFLIIFELIIAFVFLLFFSVDFSVDFKRVCVACVYSLISEKRR